MPPRDKCGSVGSGSHQLTDKEYTRELWNVVIAFSAGFLLALNKERQRHIFRKIVGQRWELIQQMVAALLLANTTSSRITRNGYKKW